MTNWQDRRLLEPLRPSGASEVVLIRHGAIDDALQGHYVGATDAPLSPLGERQALALAAPMARLAPASCLCSPLARARRTAEFGLPGVPTRVEPGLREIDFGQWECLSFEEIAQRDPGAVERWARLAEGFGFPGGETLAGFWERMGWAANTIGVEASAAPGPVAVVAHGGVIRALICLWLGLPASACLALDVGYASISVARLGAAGQGTLARLNDRHHIESEEA